MRFSTLQGWLDWQASHHPTEIELGLDRVRAVWQRLRPEGLDCVVITVAGTNGKGSTVAMAEAVLRAGGYRTGCYTSPHLLRYNERVRIDSLPASDDALVHAFGRIDAARGDISLTYFEFGTLAALDIFAREGVDVAILEVGLGGRLDAVNILDADVAIITTIDLDHTDWLGHTREEVGFEKAGIMRSGHPAVYAGLDLPRSIPNHADTLGATLYVRDRDYSFSRRGDGWVWLGPDNREMELPMPQLGGAHQLGNAAGVIMALVLLSGRLPLEVSAIREGVQSANVPGRFQVIPGEIEVVLDVAHNPQAAHTLAAELAQRQIPGHTHAVIGMLSDKDRDGVLEAMLPWVDNWYPATLEGSRGLAGGVLRDALIRRHASVHGPYCSPESAYRAAYQNAEHGDRIVVFGSFFTVAAVLGLL